MRARLVDLVCAASMKAHRAVASSSACPGVELATALAAAANTAAGRFDDANAGDGGRGGSFSLEIAVEAASTCCCVLLAEVQEKEEEEHDDDDVHAEDEDEEDEEDVWRDCRTATPVAEPLGMAGGVTSVVVVDVPALELWLLPSAKSHRAARYSGRGSSGTVARTS